MPSTLLLSDGDKRGDKMFEELIEHTPAAAKRKRKRNNLNRRRNMISIQHSLSIYWDAEITYIITNVYKSITQIKAIHASKTIIALQLLHDEPFLFGHFCLRSCQHFPSFYILLNNE